MRTVVDVVGRADLFDLALAHDDDAVGKLEGLFLVVGDEEGGVAGAVVEFAQPLAQVLANLGVECAEGLVEQQDTGLNRHGAGKRDALTLAAGELSGIAAFHAGELHHVDQFLDPAAYFSLRRARFGAAHPEAKGDIVEDGHVLEKRVMLEDEADITLLHALPRGILLAEEDAALGRIFEAGDEAQKRRLAGAGGARSAMSSPERMFSETSCRAGKSPNSLRILSMRISMNVFLFVPAVADFGTEFHFEQGAQDERHQRKGRK